VNLKPANIKLYGARGPHPRALNESRAGAWSAGRQATDIWAFGCLLYEMLTGVRPFDGEDLAETIGAVIHKPVDWTRVPHTTPAFVAMTLQRCLEKDPKLRMRDIGDVQLALSGAFETQAPVVVTPTRASRPAESEHRQL
jgi:serine/threonine protein kinase